MCQSDDGLIELMKLQWVCVEDGLAVLKTAIQGESDSSRAVCFESVLEEVIECLLEQSDVLLWLRV
jgi:hypothetical protein